MRRHPGLTLLIMAFAGMVSVLGTFVGTQIYIQSQANRREFKQQNNQVFLALVKQLSSSSATATEQRQGAILALARLDDSRAVPYLVDLLGQEKTPSLIDAIQQGLVSKGSEALPPLQRLNQSYKMTRRRYGVEVQLGSSSWLLCGYEQPTERSRKFSQSTPVNSIMPTEPH
jgi:hypothetical protein